MTPGLPSPLAIARAILFGVNTGIPFDRAGGIVLPREARRRLDLQPDSILVFSVVVQRIELTSAPGAEAVLTFAPGR